MVGLCSLVRWFLTCQVEPCCAGEKCGPKLDHTIQDVGWLHLCLVERSPLQVRGSPESTPDQPSLPPSLPPMHSLTIDIHTNISI